MKKLHITLFALTFTLAASHSVQAAVLAYEGFDYTGADVGTNLNGKSGGFGWENAWGGGSGILDNNATDINNGGLSYTNLTVEGNAAYVGAGRTGRLLDDSAAGVFGAYVDSDGGNIAQGGDLWFSLLLEASPAGAGSSNYAAVEFHGFDAFQNGSPARSFTIDARSGSAGAGGWQIELAEANVNGFANQNSADIGLRSGSGTADLVVIQMSLTNAAASATTGDSMNVYYNPTLGQPLGTPVATFTNLDIAFDNIHLADFTDDDFIADEIRFGNTLADVIPIPEPTSVALISIGALLLLRRRPRRA